MADTSGLDGTDLSPMSSVGERIGCDCGIVAICMLALCGMAAVVWARCSKSIGGVVAFLFGERETETVGVTWTTSSSSEVEAVAATEGARLGT